MDLLLIIVQSAIAAAIWFLGGLLWLRLIFPDMREALATIFLPPLFTGALVVVAVYIFDRLHVPISALSVWTVLLFNLLIAAAIRYLPRNRLRRS